MARETILIGCRLPNGIILNHPDKSKKDVKVKINGTASEKTPGGLYLPPKPFATTEVDAEFWAAWKEAHQGFPPLKNRALFEARNEQEAASKAREAEKTRTGLEQMPQAVVMDGMKLEKAVS